MNKLITQKELAAAVGITRQTVRKRTAELANAGLTGVVEGKGKLYFKQEAITYLAEQPERRGRPRKTFAPRRDRLLGGFTSQRRPTLACDQGADLRARPRPSPLADLQQPAGWPRWLDVANYRRHVAPSEACCCSAPLCIDRLSGAALRS